MSAGELSLMINGAAATICAIAAARSLWKDAGGNPGRRLLKTVLLISVLFFVYGYAARVFHMTFNDAFITLARVTIPAAFVAIAGLLYLD